MNVAFQYLQTKGSQSQSSYPYVGKVINYIALHACTLFTYGADCFIQQQTCKYNPSEVKVHCNGYKTVARSESALEKAIATVGPISVGIHVGRSFIVCRIMLHVYHCV